MRSVPGKTIEASTAITRSFLALTRSDSLNSDGIHLVAMVLFSFSGFLSLCATFFLGIQRRCARGLRDAAMVVAEEQETGKQ
jgi:hypothetical protein